MERREKSNIPPNGLKPTGLEALRGRFAPAHNSVRIMDRSHPGPAERLNPKVSVNESTYFSGVSAVSLAFEKLKSTAQMQGAEGFDLALLQHRVLGPPLKALSSVLVEYSKDDFEHLLRQISDFMEREILLALYNWVRSCGD